jgi:hypothetical protein
VLDIGRSKGARQSQPGCYPSTRNREIARKS